MVGDEPWGVREWGSRKPEIEEHPSERDTNGRSFLRVGAHDLFHVDQGLEGVLESVRQRLF